jgi:multicomponent Na+:H+ antiporter subunit C
VTLVYAATIAVLFGSGAYLMLKSDLLRVAVGMVLLSNAANLFIIASGLTRGAPPIYPLGEGEVSDPLVQAMTLTAIVISFSMAALLLSLVYRVYTSHLSLDLDDLDAAEEREEAAQEAAAEIGPWQALPSDGQESESAAVGAGSRERF